MSPSTAPLCTGYQQSQAGQQPAAYGGGYQYSTPGGAAPVPPVPPGTYPPTSQPAPAGYSAAQPTAGYAPPVQPAGGYSAAVPPVGGSSQYGGQPPPQQPPAGQVYHADYLLRKSLSVGGGGCYCVRSSKRALTQAHV